MAPTLSRSEQESEHFGSPRQERLQTAETTIIIISRTTTIINPIIIKEETAELKESYSFFDIQLKQAPKLQDAQAEKLTSLQDDKPTD